MKLNNSYCLTINDVKYNHLCEKFIQYGLSVPNKWKGLIPKEKTKSNCEQACLFGHMTILLMARALNMPFVYIFEEDAYPRKDVVNKLEFYIRNKPKDCGVLLLGYTGCSQNAVLEGNYLKSNRIFGAHAYIVYRECYDNVLNNMAKIKIADLSLNNNEFEEHTSYITKENLFIQKNLDTNSMTHNYYDKSAVPGTYMFGAYGKKNICVSKEPPPGFE